MTLTLKRATNSQTGQAEHTIIFFLPNNEYGYGYTYVAGVNDDDTKPYRSFYAQDRFSEEEMTNGIDELIEKENRTVYMDEHQNAEQALKNIINFWSCGENGLYFKDMDIAQALRVGRNLKLDYIII